MHELPHPCPLNASHYSIPNRQCVCMSTTQVHKLPASLPIECSTLYHPRPTMCLHLQHTCAQTPSIPAHEVLYTIPSHEQCVCISNTHVHELPASLPIKCSTLFHPTPTMSLLFGFRETAPNAAAKIHQTLPSCKETSTMLMFCPTHQTLPSCRITTTMLVISPSTRLFPASRKHQQ